MIKILLCAPITFDISYNAILDHFYNWFGKNLPKDKVDIKMLLRENAYFTNVDTHALDDLNPFLFSQNDVDFLFKNNVTSIPEKYLNLTNGLNRYQEDRLKEILFNKLGSWVPDLIVCFYNVSAKNVFERIYPDACFLTTENSIFCRPPFKRGLCYDYLTSTAKSSLNFFAKDIQNYKISKEDENTIIKFKENFKSLIDKHSPVNNFFNEKRKEFDKIVLLPLCSTLWNTIFDDIDYKCDYDLVCYVLENIPTNIGVFITEHGKNESFSKEEISCLKNKYKNLIYEDFEAITGNDSLYIYNNVDAVINTTSKAGIFSLFWDKPLISISKNFNNWYMETNDIKELSNILNQKYTPKNNILYWYLTHYVLFEKDFTKKDFLFNFIKNKISFAQQKKSLFSSYNQLNNINDISEYIIQSIQEFYDKSKQTKVSLYEYYRIKLLYFICFGKTKKHYKEKLNKYENIIKGL